MIIILLQFVSSKDGSGDGVLGLIVVSGIIATISPDAYNNSVYHHHISFFIYKHISRLLFYTWNVIQSSHTFT